MTRRGQGGQAAIELLAMVPVLIVVGLLAWQLMSVIGAGLRVQAELRVMAVGAAADAVAGDGGGLDAGPRAGGAAGRWAA